MHGSGCHLYSRTGTAEREAALDMLEGVHGSRRVTLGADKGYDTQDFITMCRQMNVTPHVARRKTSKLDGRTLVILDTRPASGYENVLRRYLADKNSRWRSKIKI